MKIYENLANNLIESKNNLESAHYLIEVAYVLEEDGKFLTQGATEMNNCFEKLKKIVLSFEHIEGKIDLKNLEKTQELAFFDIGINLGFSREELERLTFLKKLNIKIKASSFLFSQPNKAVFFDDSLDVDEVKYQDLLKDLAILDKLLLEVNKKFAFRKV